MSVFEGGSSTIIYKSPTYGRCVTQCWCKPSAGCTGYEYNATDIGDYYTQCVGVCPQSFGDHSDKDNTIYYFRPRRPDHAAVAVQHGHLGQDIFKLYSEHINNDCFPFCYDTNTTRPTWPGFQRKQLGPADSNACYSFIQNPRGERESQMIENMRQVGFFPHFPFAVSTTTTTTTTTTITTTTTPDAYERIEAANEIILRKDIKIGSAIAKQRIANEASSVIDRIIRALSDSRRRRNSSPFDTSGPILNCNDFSTKYNNLLDRMEALSDENIDTVDDLVIVLNDAVSEGIAHSQRNLVSSPAHPTRILQHREQPIPMQRRKQTRFPAFMMKWRNKSIKLIQRTMNWSPMMSQQLLQSLL